MNSKKKNKKAHKPPNPNPPQNVESESKKEKIIEENQSKCEVKQDLLPVEIPSEISVGAVCEVKEVESETPKKPKRNKSKNKKNDKEEDKIEVLDVVQEIAVKGNPDVSQEVIDEKVDPLEDANIVPSARKKKNKKKGQDKDPEEPKLPIEDVIISSLETEKNIDKTEPAIQELFAPNPELSKEGKKKKNKKKNRNDSERSDKSDNILSCTSAFQKILAEDQALKQEQIQVSPVAKPENIDSNIRLEHENKKECETEEYKPLKENTEYKPEEIKELPKEETKSKKKNKKEKKQDIVAKTTTTEDEPGIPEKVTAQVEVVTDILPDILPAVTGHDTKALDELLPELQKHKNPSPKAKAKIAKPVEKNRKEKIEPQPLEHISIVECSETKEDKGMLTLATQYLPKVKSDEIPAFNITEPIMKINKNQEVPVSDLPVKSTALPSDQAMGKKRKKSKSPKPPKNKEAAKDNIKSNVEPEIILLGDTNILTQPAEIILGLEAVGEPKNVDKVTTQPDTLSQEADTDEKIQIIDLPKLEAMQRPLTPEKKQDNEGFEIKTSKKKKKTPKTPTVETYSELREPSAVPTEKTEHKGDNSNQTKKENKIDIALEPLLLPEIRTDRKDPEALSGDLVPEVFFVRSASQQLLDTNNNTVIQEVTNADELKLRDTYVTPLVEGSGESPIATPELISSGIKMMNVETKSSVEEKTDIKSKMMEVNQDMEDLRLSIERSLAGFVALDKCEADLEQKNEKIKVKKEALPAKENKEVEKTNSEVETLIQTKLEMPLTIEKNEPKIVSSDIIKEGVEPITIHPVCPARKDNKGKGKSKKKGKQESVPASSAATSSSNISTVSEPKDKNNDEKKEKSDEKSEQKSESTQDTGKQKSASANDKDNSVASNEESPSNAEIITDSSEPTDFEPIENFEDALTSSIDDVNKSFEMIAKDVDDDNIAIQKKLAANKPEISITEPTEDKDKDTNKNEKVNPVSQPKNLLGHTDIPVQSNKTDYKKEKNKTPNARQARVKVKDSSEIEPRKQSKESQTCNKRTGKISDKSVKESFSRVNNDCDEYVYKYSFRKVFLQSACHVCNKELVQVRVPCGYCNLIFYCGTKHKDEDWPQHQALCFAVSTLAHMKDQKHVYADAQNTAGQDYRLLRMQMIVSCEKVLKRRLVPWEQEIMLYPRICAEVACREWKQSKLKDCDGCGQISYCASNNDHFPKAHARWCKSYSLYKRLVSYQQTKGRLEPRLPTRVLAEDKMPGKMNEVLAAMYEEKIDMDDIQYASLTQLATAPLTTAYCLQLCRNASALTNGVHKKHPFTIHIVGAELQFEADALNKWETFFLHVRPDVDELRVVMISPALNPGQLPLHLLGKIKLCEECQHSNRRVVFKFEDNKNYSQYRSCEDFIYPDIICAFNPSIQRSSIYNGKDPWPASINSILKLKTPFIVTAYTLNELRKDIARIKQVSEMDFKFISEPGFNSFASVRPDRNFISDDEMPLLFKNYCFSVVVGC